MSQQAVEEALGRMICDDSFRTEFSKDASGTAMRAGLPLTATELSCLHKVNPRFLETLAAQIDERIRRLKESFSY